MESRSCKNSRRRNCTTLASPFISPCSCLITVKPTRLMNSLTRPIPASFSPKRESFCREHWRDKLLLSLRRQPPRRRSHPRPPIPRRINRMAPIRWLLVVSEKLLCSRSVSCLYSSGIKGKRRERDASGVYFLWREQFPLPDFDCRRRRTRAAHCTNRGETNCAKWQPYFGG